MIKSPLKPSLTTRTLQFGSSFAAGAMMLSRMNRSEISRYDDLVSDLCRLQAPEAGPSTRDRSLERPPRGRWTRWAIGSPRS